MNKRTHSYSSLKLYKQCPKQYKALYIDKSIKRQSSPALEKGIRMHKHMEDAVNHATKLPRTLAKWEPLVSKLRRAGAEAEKEFAVTEQLEPTTFWSKNAWLRGKVDIMLPGRVIDFKSGQVRPDPFQGEFYRVLAREPIRFNLVYLEHNTVVRTRPPENSIDNIRVVAYSAEHDTRFPARPSFLCRYCPVKTCKYNEAR